MIESRRWLGLVGLLVFLWNAWASPLSAQAPRLNWKKIEVPPDWEQAAGDWIRTTPRQFQQFQKFLSASAEGVAVHTPVILKSTYTARLDGQLQLKGEFLWKLQHLDSASGCVTLGKSSLSVSQMTANGRPVIQGINPQGDWQLWCEELTDEVGGEWTQRGSVLLSSRKYDIVLPRSLSASFDLELPREWEARISGTNPETQPGRMADTQRWIFDLGRQTQVQLRIEPARPQEKPRVLIRENSIYGLTTTDDLIRMRSDWECVVQNARQADLKFAVPKPLRVFHVMLSGEIALPFERDLGSEMDQIRIPLRSLVPGQRLSLQILSEIRRNADKATVLPRILPVDAIVQEGTILVAVDRPLEIRSIETQGARPIQQTEEGGKELRKYELLRPDCRISVHVGEPVPVLTGDVRFLADLRGETPHCRARVRMATREGELYSPQLLIPPGWDPISITLADSLDATPAAWSANRVENGETIVGLELRQPIRSDRDCTILIDLKSTPVSTKSSPLRLPAPRIVNAQECVLQGVLWDQQPWELIEKYRPAAETDNDPPDAEFLLSMNWGDPASSPAIPTGVRVPEWRTGSEPLFQHPDVVPQDFEESSQEATPSSGALLSAHVELDTVTMRQARAHVHQAVFRLSRPASPREVVINLSHLARPIRVTTQNREIPFVHQDSRLTLDPAAKPMSEFVLEYQTDADPGWIVSRDLMCFPRIECLVTEFVWRLNLDSQRRLYKLPLTAASTPREQYPIWQRLLGPLSRSSGESVFNPLRPAQWKELLNGGGLGDAGSRREELWFICPQIPSDFPMKTWNTAIASELAWSCFLLWLALGIGFRRARSPWFSKWWIYGGGVFLVLSIFVGEPYAPIAGASFLGVVLAILIPRRFALGTSWISTRPRQSTANLLQAGILGLLTLWWCEHLTGQQTQAVEDVEFFEIDPSSPEEPSLLFSARRKDDWDNWLTHSDRPDWLLSSGEYHLEEGDRPLVMVATFRFMQFRSDAAPLRIPLEGVSLEQAWGQLDGKPVRLIPATDGHGFLLPLQDEAKAGTMPRQRTALLRFRPLRDPGSESLVYTGRVQTLPESTLTLPEQWTLELTDLDSRFHSPQPGFSGFSGPFRLRKGDVQLQRSDNVTDVSIRTLVECGPIGARVQTGVLPQLSDPSKSAEVTLQFPPSLQIQSVSGPGVQQSEFDDADARYTTVRIALRPNRTESPDPIEIVSYLAGDPSGYQLTTPVWRPSGDQVPSESAAMSTMVGVSAKPGFQVHLSDNQTSPTAVTPQGFSDSLFAGIAWQIPDAAWSCRPGEAIRWHLVPVEVQGRGQLRQELTIDSPRSRWLLDGKIEVSSGVPFEHRFVLDPRLDIQRASVTQDGAERLYRWTVETDPDSHKKTLILTIRDGQPGTQLIRLEGQWKTESEEWIPPLAEYASGQTQDHVITLKHTSRVNSDIQGGSSVTRGDEQHDYQYRPLELDSPQTIRVKPIQQERLAKAWIHLQPREDRSWQLTLRAQLKDNLPASPPIAIQWDSPGVSDVRPLSRRDAVRIHPDKQGFLWHPQSTSTRAAELILTAHWTPESGELIWPQLTGVRWSESWITLPRGVGYRPSRRVAAVAPEFPATWPENWAQEFRASRLDLFASHQERLEIEEFSDDSMPRPVWAESLVWLGQGSDVSHSSETCQGTTKYLLISERSVVLSIPDAWREYIRAVSIQGKIQSIEQPVRLQARPQDMSFEVVVFWEVPAERISDIRDWFEFPEKHRCPHRWAIVPPHHQLVLTGESLRSEYLASFWLSRAEEILRTSVEFRGATWLVDGPLVQHLAKSRQELLSDSRLSTADLSRRADIERRWTEFTKHDSRMSSPIAPESATPDLGLDAAIALCGESRSLWIPPPDTRTVSIPTLLDRRWALGISATLAALVSLGLLVWFVRLFRRFDIPERLAARPNATLIGVGIIWWLGLSPSVLGLAITGAGVALWFRDRRARQSLADSSRWQRSMAPNADA